MGLFEKLKIKLGLKKLYTNLEFNEKKQEMISKYEKSDFKDFDYREIFESAENAEDYGIKGFKTTYLMHDGKLVVCEDVVRTGGRFLPLEGYPIYKFLEKDNNGQYIFKTLKNVSYIPSQTTFVFESENEDGYFEQVLPEISADNMFIGNYQDIAACYSEIKALKLAERENSESMEK